MAMGLKYWLDRKARCLVWSKGRDQVSHVPNPLPSHIYGVRSQRAESPTPHSHVSARFVVLDFPFSVKSPGVPGSASNIGQAFCKVVQASSFRFVCLSSSHVRSGK